MLGLGSMHPSLLSHPSSLILLFKMWTWVWIHYSEHLFFSYSLYKTVYLCHAYAPLASRLLRIYLWLELCLVFIVTGGDSKPGKAANTWFCCPPRYFKLLMHLPLLRSAKTQESLWYLLFLKSIDCQQLQKPPAVPGECDLAPVLCSAKVFICLVINYFPLNYYRKIVANGCGPSWERNSF